MTGALGCIDRAATSYARMRRGLQGPQLAVQHQQADVGRRSSRCQALKPAADAKLAVVAEDKWIAKMLTAAGRSGGDGSSQGLASLHLASSTALATTRMPSTRNEEYRFTDITPILKSSYEAAPGAAAVPAARVAGLTFPEAANSTAVVVNGVFRQDLSTLSALPAGVYVGSIAGAPKELVAQHLGAQAAARGGPFTLLNGATAADVLCVILPPGAAMAAPLYILHLATSGSEASKHWNAPRLLLHAGAGAAVEVLEEYAAASDGDGAAGHYMTCSTSELVLEQGANVKHGYAQREAAGAYHTKCTLVSQAASSSYTLAEARVGGGLSRHDLIIEQEGKETETVMRHFLLAGPAQLHDLHTKLRLSHPAGAANQLHKCIVSSATGRGVFDGNVKVERLAQMTDAGQLSRNLLLVPRATVNVKPNLQIIADDVKCTHGCSVSDLSEEELFYFRARGISAEKARQALVFSFGAEVIAGLRYGPVKARIQADAAATLDQVEGLSAAEQGEQVPTK